MILRRIKAGPWVESFMAFVIDGHGASEQLDRFAWMAVVRTAFAAAAGSASGLDFSRFPAMTAGGTVRTLRMQADDGGQRSVCPQEGVEQAMKGVPGFDVVGRRGRALMRFRHCLAWADLVRRCDE